MMTQQRAGEEFWHRITIGNDRGLSMMTSRSADAPVCRLADVPMRALIIIINNNNNHVDIYSAVIMTTKGHCKSSLGSFDEGRTAPSSRRPSDT